MPKCPVHGVEMSMQTVGYDIGGPVCPYCRDNGRAD